MGDEHVGTFSASLSQSLVPPDWKSINMSTIFKKATETIYLTIGQYILQVYVVRLWIT